MGAPRSAAPPPGRDNAVGIALIAVAVIVGLVLLAKGFSREGSLISTKSGGATTTTLAASATTVAPTSTTVAARPPAQVPVVVANGSGKSGIAGARKATLESKGYTQVTAANAPSTATTVVYFAQGAQPEAEAVASVLGLPATSVQAMPAKPPVDPGGALVLVVVGTDTA